MDRVRTRAVTARGENEPIRFETLAKRGGGSRTLVHLGMTDGRRYEHAVADVIPSIERSLRSGVAANRARVTGGRLELEPFTLARRRYLRSLRAAAGGAARAAFVGDVRDCYGSITPASVSSALRFVGAPPDHIEHLGVVLHGFDSLGITGLPVGPDPSAVLANAVLVPVDAALREATGGAVLRWVDDVVVLARDVAEAWRAAAVFQRALGELGLSPNPAKCRVVDEPAGLLGLGSTSSPCSSARHGMMRPP